MNTHNFESDPELIILRGIEKGPTEVIKILSDAFDNILFDLEIIIKSIKKEPGEEYPGKIEVTISGWYESDVTEEKGFEEMQEKLNDVIGTKIENN